MEKSVNIKLLVPIERDGEVVKELTMRRSTVRDERIAAEQAQSAAAREILTIASLCGLTPDQFDTMDSADYRKCQEIFAGFLGLTPVPMNLTG